MVFAIDCGCGWPGWRGLEPGRAPRSGRYLRRQGKRRSCEASFPYAPPSPRSSSSPLLFDGDAMSGGCGSLPVVAVRDSPRSRHAQRPAHRCRRRAAHAGSVAALSAALAAASTSPSPRCRAGWWRTPPAPLRGRAPARAIRAPGRRQRLGDELARRRVPRGALRLRSRACAVPAALDRRVRADVAASRRSARRAALPRRGTTQWWGRRASPRRQHAAPPS